MASEPRRSRAFRILRNGVIRTSGQPFMHLTKRPWCNDGHTLNSLARTWSGALSAVVRCECLYDRVELTIHDEIELVQSESDAMVRHPVLRKIVRTDRLTRIGAAAKSVG